MKKQKITVFLGIFFFTCFALFVGAYALGAGKRYPNVTTLFCNPIRIEFGGYQSASILAGFRYCSVTTDTVEQIDAWYEQNKFQQYMKSGGLGLFKVEFDVGFDWKKNDPYYPQVTREAFHARGWLFSDVDIDPGENDNRIVSSVNLHISIGAGGRNSFP